MIWSVLGTAYRIKLVIIETPDLVSLIDSSERSILKSFMVQIMESTEDGTEHVNLDGLVNIILLGK